MNYSKIYAELISKARNREIIPGEYYENHHIILKSMGGSNEIENIVSLTAKEHFVAHHVLWRMHRNQQTASAFWMMCMKTEKQQRLKVSARNFVIARKLMSESLSIARLGKKTGFKHTADSKLRMSLAKKGIPKSEESKAKMRKPKCESHRINCSLSKRGRKMSEEGKLKLSQKRKGRSGTCVGRRYIIHSESLQVKRVEPLVLDKFLAEGWRLK